LSVQKTTILRAAAAFLAILLLLAGLLALAPRWIQLEPIKRRLLESASRSLGAEVTCERIDLALLPRPRIAMHGVRLRIPGKAEGTVETLEVAPTIVSLIRRDIRIARIRAVAPDFRLTLPSGKKPPPTPDEAREMTARALSTLAASVPGAVVEIARGRLTLLRDGRTLDILTGLDARLVAPPGALRAEIACTSTYWKRMTAEIRLDPDGLRAGGKIRVTRLAGDRIAPFLPAPGALRFPGAVPDLGIDFSGELFRTLRADVTGTLPVLDVRRAARRLVARDVRLSGTVDLGEKAFSLTALRVASESPKVRLSGEVRRDLPDGATSLSLSAAELDVSTLRESLLALVGDSAPLPQVFDWVRGGTIPKAAFAWHGVSLSSPGALDNITFRAELRDGTLHVVPAKLDVTDVRGDVSLVRSVLVASRVSARSGKSNASGAGVSVFFGRKGHPYHVDVPIRGDLSHLPAVLARLPLPEGAAKFFAGFSSLSGSATGRLTIDRSDAGIRTRVGATAIRMSGSHRLLPRPFVVDNGSLSLDGAAIRLTGLAGSVGRTKFDGIGGLLQAGGEFPVTGATGRIGADLAELSPWIATLPGGKTATGGISAAGGMVDLSILRLEGPLARPRKLVFEGRGTVRDLRLEGGALPGPLTLVSGNFHVAPDAISFDPLRGSLLDADLHGSGAWRHLREGSPDIEVTGLGGVLGPESVRRLLALVKAPAAFSSLRAPIDLSGVRARRGVDNATSVAGTFSVRGGPVVTLDLAARPGTLDIRSASIRDESSDATASLKKSPDGLSLRFTGRLAAASIGRLFPGREQGNESISGDIRITIPIDDVFRLTADGTLEAKALRFPELLGPLSVTRLSLSAANDRLAIHSADLAWDGKPLTLGGTLSNKAGKLIAELDVHAAALSREEIDRALARFRTDSRPPGQPWRLPVAGTIRLSADAFTWGSLAWRPVRADVALEPEAVSVTVREAELCGISTPGTFRVTPEGTAVDFRASASGRPIGDTLSCLGNADFKMTGTYSLTAHVTGRGRGDALVSSLRGPVTFEARKGRINKANILMKVLAVLNVTQLLVGKVPDFAGEGFAYNSLRFRGDVKEGRLVIPHAVLDAASANLAAEGSVDLRTREVDGVLLASPFKTIDTIIRAIPLVRYILKGRLVAVPFGIKGPVGDPSVTVLPPAEVGAGLLGVVERTLKLPVRLIAPILPEGWDLGKPGARPPRP
jgi:hypothetical protein